MPRPGDKEATVGAKLTAANGSGITTYGRRKRKIKLQCGELSWIFIVAKAKNIIGADMLRRFELLPDLQGQRLLNLKSYSMVRGFLEHVPDGIRGIYMVVASVPGSFEEEIKKIVKQRPKLTEQTFQLTEAPHGIEHEIVTTGQPIRCRPRRQNPEKMRLNFSSSKRWASPSDQTVRGRRRCTSRPNPMGDGGLAVISGGSMQSRYQTVTRCQGFTILRMVWQAGGGFPR
jgi:hypothetical protein